jgi:hypothetical protein
MHANEPDKVAKNCVKIILEVMGESFIATNSSSGRISTPLSISSGGTTT